MAGNARIDLFDSKSNRVHRFEVDNTVVGDDENGVKIVADVVVVAAVAVAVAESSTTERSVPVALDGYCLRLKKAVAMI